MAEALRLPGLAAQTCGVCGCTGIRTDEVDEERAALRLCECPRCDHRWTERLRERRPVAAARPSLRVLREGASAA